MVGLGVLMLLLGVLGAFKIARGKLYRGKGYLRFALCMGPTGFIAPAIGSIPFKGLTAQRYPTEFDGIEDGLNVIIGSDSLPRLFMTPPRVDFDVMDVDFDHAAEDVAQMGALNDATSTYLSTFAERGGKMVIVHGMSDPVFSANDIMRCDRGHWRRLRTALHGAWSDPLRRRSRARRLRSAERSGGVGGDGQCARTDCCHRCSIPWHHTAFLRVSARGALQGRRTVSVRPSHLANAHRRPVVR